MSIYLRSIFTGHYLSGRHDETLDIPLNVYSRSCGSEDIFNLSFPVIFAQFLEIKISDKARFNLETAEHVIFTCPLFEYWRG